MLTREQEILDKALAAFQKQTNVRVEKQQAELRLDNNKRADAGIRIHFPGTADTEFWVEVRPTLTETIIPRVVRQFEGNLQKWILVTRYVYRQMAMTMKDLGLQFIDTAGNAYINRPPALIFIQGNPRQEETIKVGEEGMLGTAGLRVLFALLCKRELWNANYREIKTAAGVALGTVAGTMKDLTAQGYLVELQNGERRLLRRKELLDKWTYAYAAKMRPKRMIGRYHGPKPDFWQQADLTRFEALWGGETAAYQLTRYLKPEITTIYANKPINDLVLNLKLREDNKGDVEIRDKFWTFDTVETDRTLVPPLLVYADLIATGDARNIETAKMVYGDYLERRLRED